jgi:large subunit ribosomal protein L25
MYRKKNLMETPKLEAQIRELLGKKASQLKEQGLAPAVIYGKSIKPINLAVSQKDFLNLYENAGDNTLIELTITGIKEKHKVLIQNVHFAPFRDSINNIEFFAVSLTETVEVEVPVNLINTEAAEKLGGMIIKVMQEIEIETLPDNIPHQIDVDCSSLTEFGKTIFVRDLSLEKGIKILSSLDSPIVTFDEPAKEEAPLVSAAPAAEAADKKPADDKKEEVKK